MKTRIISAIIALLIFIPLIWLGSYPFAIAMGVLSILGYKEMMDLKESKESIPDGIKILGLLCVLYLVLGNYGSYSLEYSVSLPRLLLPFVLLLIPVVFYRKDEYLTKNAFTTLGIVYLIGIFFNLLIAVRSVNISLLIYLLSVTILTDTFAYAIGKLIGKNKMCPKISPHKTWEGFFGGLIGGSLGGLIVYGNLLGPISLKVVFVTIVLSLVGQIGDLFYSKIKRENKIKDFSNIMPGHGGVLDRVDSLSFVVFGYVILYWLI